MDLKRMKKEGIVFCLCVATVLFDLSLGLSMLYQRRQNEQCPLSQKIMSITVGKMRYCAELCLGHNKCNGFCYGKAKKECILLDFDSGSSNEDTTGLDLYWASNLASHYRIGYKIYKVMMDKEKWLDAVSSCSDIGMTLAIPVNSDENALLMALEIKHGTLWMNGHDRTVEGSWVNGMTNRAFNFSDWDPNQPGGGASEDCLMMYVDEEWHDYGCGYEKKYVCEHIYYTGN